ncbi:MAG: preprotein translocase subunit SecG [Bdellovibrionales bacterium]|nr:preprotein translocase subunit SecG [Bdellovibrionales bacterium]
MTNSKKKSYKQYMFTFLSIVHIIASVIMILFILLQDPKGGGGAFGIIGGGGSKSLFGNTGGNQFLVNVTKFMAVIFAFTSIYLAALSSQKEDSVMDEYTQEAPNKPMEQQDKPPVETNKDTPPNEATKKNTSKKTKPALHPVEEQAPLPSSQNLGEQKESDANKSNTSPSNKVNSPPTQPTKEEENNQK